nr:MAG TPA: hypothetical protein [Caudoviricetes sp.]
MNLCLRLDLVYPPSCRETARGTTKGVITHALIKIYQVMY